MAETEAAAGAHNNQPTDGIDSDRKVVCGDGNSNGAAVAVAVVTVAMAAVQSADGDSDDRAREIYIKWGRKGATAVAAATAA